MSLKRKAIRQAVAALLKGNTGAGDRVTTNRSDIPQWAKHLPALSVYTRGDPARVWTQTPLVLIRQARIVVEAWIDTVDEGFPADDDLDVLCGQVEDLVTPRMTAFAHLFGMHLTETAYEGVETFVATLDGEVPLAGARLVWVFAYLQEIDELDPAECAAFLQTHVDWDFGTADTPEATDDIAHPGP